MKKLSIVIVTALYLNSVSCEVIKFDKEDLPTYSKYPSPMAPIPEKQSILDNKNFLIKNKYLYVYRIII